MTKQTLEQSDLYSECGVFTPCPSQDTDDETTALQQTRDNLTASASANGICEIKDILDAELLRCQEKSLFRGTRKSQRMAHDGQQWSRQRMNDLLGGLDGTSWQRRGETCYQKEMANVHRSLSKIRF